MDEIEQILRIELGIKDDGLVRMGMDSSYVRYIPKGEYLARQDDTLPGVAFLINGLFRFFFLGSDGREHTDCFVINLDIRLHLRLILMPHSLLTFRRWRTAVL